MKQHIFLLACLCSAAFVYVSAVPLPAGDRELDVLQIPLTNGKEIDVLTLGSTDQEQAIAERNKRTIGLLRELFPDITKQIDGIVNRIIGQVIRVAGPSLLPALLGNNRPSTTARSDSDFDAGFDDVEENDDSDNDVSSNDVNSNSLPAIGTRVQIDLPTFAPDTKETATPAENDNESTTSVDEARKVSVRMTTTPATTFSSITNNNNVIPSTTTTTTTSSTTSTTTTTPATTTTTFLPFPTTNRTLIPTTATIVDTTSTSFSLATSPATATASTTTATNDVATNNDDNDDDVVDDSEIVAIIENLNRLLNSTNYFITTRDNLPTTINSNTDMNNNNNNNDNSTSTTTARITKLLPVNN